MIVAIAADGANVYALSYLERVFFPSGWEKRFYAYNFISVSVSKCKITKHASPFK